LAIALVGLLVGHAPMAVQGGPATAVPQWWGPTEIGEGFHLRVGATVSNTGPTALPNPVASLEVDIGQALAQAGWPSANVGESRLLRGFHLDPDSLRVVAMTDLLPPAPGTSHGLLRAIDTSMPPGDMRRYEVASAAYEGSFTRLVQFHAGANPVVTIVWRLGETLPPGATRSFMLYFDSDLTTDPKPAADHGSSLPGGDAESLFWTGPGTVLHGLSVPVAGRGLPLHVIALQPDTSVEVLTALPGQAFQRAEQFRIEDAPAERPVFLPGTSSVLVKVVADKPVIAQMISTGFAPSADAGISGRDFLFMLTHPGSWEQDTIYFKAVDPRAPDGALDPTTVEVTRLADGSTYRYTMGSAGGQGNPWNYTVGGRAAIDDETGCVRPIPGASSPALPFGPGLYRARVISGERVMLQYQAVDGISQVPTDAGAPAGTRFWGALPWSDEIGWTGTCEVRVRPGAMHALPTAGAATLTATSPELGYQVFPRGAPNPPAARMPPGRLLTADGGLQGPFDVNARDSADRMLAVSTTAPVVLFAGQSSQQVGTHGDVPPFAAAVMQSTATPPLHGPLGGQAGGRVFAGPGNAVVVALFDGTEVEVRSRFVSGIQTNTLRLAKDSSLALEGRAANDPLLDYTIHSNLPLVVHPAQATSATFAGIPALVPAVAGAASFRGYLLDLTSDDGDPAMRSTPPDTPVTYRVKLANVGRAADGSGLADTVALAHDAPAGWAVVVDGVALDAGQPRTYLLGAGQGRELVVTVQPPASAAIETAGIVTLTATSRGNDRVRDTLQLVTFVKTLFEVEAWFDGVDGPKEQERTVLQGAASYNLIVQNRGSKTELIDLKVEFKGGPKGWQAQLGDDQVATMQVELAPAPDVLEIPLRLVAPPSLVEGEVTAIVTASLADVSSAKDTVQAIARQVAPSDFVLEASVLTSFIDAGGRATFDFVLRNRGAGGATVHLEAQGSTSQGWSVPRVALASQEEPLGEVSLAAADAVTLRLTVDASAQLRAGAIDLVRFAAVTDDGAAVEQVFLAQIKAKHRLEVTLPPQPMAAEPGGEHLQIPLSIRNAGNLDEVLRIQQADVPSGWNLSIAPEAIVRQGTTQQAMASLAVPEDQAPGLFNITLSLVARDGNQTLVPMRVQIDNLGRAGIAASRTTLAQPGQRLVISAPVENHGNTPLEVRVVPDAGEPWTLVPPPARILAPGEEAQISLAWQVPFDASDGESVHRARLEFASDSIQPVPPQTFEVNITVGRADLSVLSVTAGTGPAGTLVRAALTNLGTRPAIGFDVDLLASNGTLVDRVHVGFLQASATVNVSLVLPTGTHGALVVDSGGTVVESDETDNGAVVEAAPPRGGVPLPPWVALAAVVLALLRVRRNRA
jgi:uncharacterized membrane protein